MPRPKAFDEGEVLHKAMELFWTKGYHDTSIKDLIESLGISNASIYHTFGGKQQLFVRTLEHYHTLNYTGLSAYMDKETDVKKGLEMIFAKIVQDDVEDQACKGCFMVNTTTELLPGEMRIQALVSNHKVRMEALFLAFLEKGVKSGQIDEGKDIATISRLLYTTMTGMRVLGKTQPDPKEVMSTVKAVLSLLH